MIYRSRRKLLGHTPLEWKMFEGKWRKWVSWFSRNTNEFYQAHCFTISLILSTEVQVISGFQATISGRFTAGALNQRYTIGFGNCFAVTRKNDLARDRWFLCGMLLLYLTL